MPAAASERLLEVLAEARASGFLGPGRVDDHARHAVGFAETSGSAPGRMLDLGSGGGVPGLILAQLWTEAELVLLDGSARRTAFLEAAVRTLGLQERVQVVRAPAEEAARDTTLRGMFDLVTARSFAVPAATAECGAPFLRVGGALIVSEPPDPGEDRWPPEAVRVLGLSAPARSGGFVRLEVATLTSDRFPRRVGVPAKRPLW